MDKIEIIPGQTDRAIAIMGETARFYRERGFRIWPEEWLTREQLVNAEARPSVSARWRGRTPAPLSSSGGTPSIGAARPRGRRSISINSASGRTFPTGG